MWLQFLLGIGTWMFCGGCFVALLLILFSVVFKVRSKSNVKSTVQVVENTGFHPLSDKIDEVRNLVRAGDQVMVERALGELGKLLEVWIDEDNDDSDDDDN